MHGEEIRTSNTFYIRTQKGNHMENFERKKCGILDSTGKTKCPQLFKQHAEKGTACDGCVLFETMLKFRKMANELDNETKI